MGTTKTSASGLPKQRIPSSSSQLSVHDIESAEKRDSNRRDRRKCGVGMLNQEVRRLGLAGFVDVLFEQTKRLSEVSMSAEELRRTTRAEVVPVCRL